MLDLVLSVDSLLYTYTEYIVISCILLLILSLQLVWHNSDLPLLIKTVEMPIYTYQ